MDWQRSSMWQRRWLCVLILALALTFTSICTILYWQGIQQESLVALREADLDYYAGVVETAEWQENEIYEITSEQDAFENLDIVSTPARRVVIGAVSCRNLTSPDTMKYSEETAVMLKSVLISAMVYNISEVELHLFLEHPEDEQFFARKFKEMGFFTSQTVNVLVFTHSAIIDRIPLEHREHMLYHPRYRCGYTRFFFPLALPEVDSIIHLDSDMIITGSLWKIWSEIGQFNDDQIIGVSRSNEANDTEHLNMYQRWFSDIPHPPPKGVNAGLLLMNLTRMREYQWEQKFLQTYNNYSNQVNLTGQRTVNILLGTDLKILKTLSCQLNFFHRHCDKGFSCLDALVKGQGGIHLVHGNGKKMERGKVFHALFRFYQHFNMGLVHNKESNANELLTILKEHLMTPIRVHYAQPAICTECYGTLYQGLYLDFYS